MITNTEQGKRLSGFFLGKVLKHCEHGKCKIYIPGVYPETYATLPDNLPDALQVAPMFGGSLKGNGIFSYPNIDSTVICGFLNEDQNQPIYWGAIQGDEESAGQYGEARCEIDDDSIKSGDDARVHKITVDKSTIKIYESGKIEIKVFKDRKYQTGKETPDIGCHIDINENGTINIHSSTQIQMSSPEIVMDTNHFTLKTETTSITASDNIGIKSNKYMTIESSDELDVMSQTENHINFAHNTVATGQISIDGAYVGLKGKTHPPVFI